jgi:hypothetical protein
MKIKRLVDKPWKLALVGVFGAFALLTILALIIGPTPAKATADNAIKACRSSNAAPRVELLDSATPTQPDGVWTAQEDTPGTFSMIQSVDTGLFSAGQGPTTYNPHPISAPWVCTATMAKDGMWTVTWDAGRTAGRAARPLTVYVSNADLRTVAPPRDLSGPGYGG